MMLQVRKEKPHKSSSEPELSTYGTVLSFKKKLSRTHHQEINSYQKVQCLMMHFLRFGACRALDAPRARELPRPSPRRRTGNTDRSGNQSYGNLINLPLHEGQL